MSKLTKLTERIADLRVSSAKKSAESTDSNKAGTSTAGISRCPVAIRDGKHVVTQPTVDLLEVIGGRDRLLALTSRFYPKMFRDQQLSKFVMDERDPHPERLANWIAEKMSGKRYWSSTLADRAADQPYDRSSAHFKAWHSPKREPERYGSHFKLDDTVIWMRLMFWACREEGLDTEPFFSWYKAFIAHFSRVYERSAPPYVEEAARWSTDPANIAKYEADGWLMKDVLHLRSPYSF